MFVKQYGAEASGTNALRAALHGVPGVVVLMHVLGDKHSPPTRLVLGEAVDWSRPAATLVREATVERPALSTDLADPGQAAYVDAVAEPLVAALRSRALRIAVSVRDPYGWAAAIMRRAAWPRWADGSLTPSARRALETACRRASDAYRSWFDLVDARPALSAVVRHEDLVAGRADVERLASYGAPVRPPPGLALSAHWDDVPPRVHHVRFDDPVLRRRRRTDELDSDLRSVVARAIDWEVFGRAGYAP